MSLRENCISILSYIMCHLGGHGSWEKKIPSIYHQRVPINLQYTNAKYNYITQFLLIFFLFNMFLNIDWCLNEKKF